MPATKDMRSTVILVNEQDIQLGTAEKLAAHEQGLLHRAFSIFLFRNGKKGRELLLQQRANDKYHSAGLWTNSCCSHPSPGENIIEAAYRRLKEELGITTAVLSDVGQFHYIAHFNNGLTENELDHVLVGEYCDEELNPDPAEIQAYCWMEIAALKKALREKPETFTPWLEKALAIAEKVYR